MVSNVTLMLAAITPIAFLCILLILKRILHIKMGTPIFRVLVLIVFSTTVLSDIILLSDFISDVNLAGLAILASIIFIVWTWYVTLRTIRNQESATLSESQKLRNVLTQGQQA